MTLVSTMLTRIGISFYLSIASERYLQLKVKAYILLSYQTRPILE